MTKTLGILAVCMLLLTAVSGCTALTGETLGQNIDDTNITAAVKVKLMAERDPTRVDIDDTVRIPLPPNGVIRQFKGALFVHVDVDTVRGVVYLGGEVATDADRVRAEHLASQVAGVQKVVNSLQVQKR